MKKDFERRGLNTCKTWEWIRD